MGDGGGVRSGLFYAEPILDLISVTGPPWYDEYTGKELDAAGVQAAMDKEIGSFKAVSVKREVPT